MATRGASGRCPLFSLNPPSVNFGVRNQRYRSRFRRLMNVNLHYRARRCLIRRITSEDDIVGVYADGASDP